MKKKLTILFLCLTLTAAPALSGCTGDTEGAKEPSDTSATESGSQTADTSATEFDSQTAELPEQTEQAESSEKEKSPATDFAVTLLNGDTVNLSDYQGKKVLLNFWATWCGPCVREMPALQQLSEEYPDELVVLAVNCGDSEQDVQDFAEENGYTFPIGLDEDMTVSTLYGAYSIPLTIIVDEDGYITYASRGAADADTMYNQYKEALGL